MKQEKMLGCIRPYNGYIWTGIAFIVLGVLLLISRLKQGEFFVLPILCFVAGIAVIVFRCVWRVELYDQYMVRRAWNGKRVRVDYTQVCGVYRGSTSFTVALERGKDFSLPAGVVGLDKLEERLRELGIGQEDESDESGQA